MGLISKTFNFDEDLQAEKDLTGKNDVVFFMLNDSNY